MVEVEVEVDGVVEVGEEVDGVVEVEICRGGG